MKNIITGMVPATEHPAAAITATEAMTITVTEAGTVLRRDPAR